MLHKTEGIVIRSVKYSETSLISRIFTRELGVQSYIVNGVRGTKARYAGAPLLQAASILQLEVYHKEHKKLQRIREFNPAYLYQNIPRNVVRGSLALFLMEVSNKAIISGVRNQEVFDLLKSCLMKIDREEKVGNYHLHYLIRLSQILGFGPQFRDGYHAYFNLREGVFQEQLPGHGDFMDEESSFLLARLITEADSLSSVAADQQMRKNLLRMLLRFYELHLDHFGKIRSQAILESVFAARPPQS